MTQHSNHLPAPRQHIQGLIDDMKAAARRGDAARADSLSDQLSVLVMAHTVPVIDGMWDAFGLTRKERALADFLHSKIGSVVPKHAIHEALYFDDPNGGPEDDIVDVFICRLRKKLEKARAPFHIETVFGSGFRMKAGTGNRVSVITSEGVSRGYSKPHGRPKDIHRKLASA